MIKKRICLDTDCVCRVFARLGKCVPACRSHLHWTLLPSLSPFSVYIIPNIDFRLDYLSPTYSSQIRKQCSLYPQFNRLEGGGDHSQTKCNEFNAYWGEKPPWMVCICVELMGYFQLDKAWVIPYVCVDGRELVGVIYISVRHCLCGTLQHTRPWRYTTYKHSFGNNVWIHSILTCLSLWPQHTTSCPSCNWKTIPVHYSLEWLIPFLSYLLIYLKTLDTSPKKTIN